MVCYSYATVIILQSRGQIPHQIRLAIYTGGCGGGFVIRLYLILVISGQSRVKIFSPHNQTRQLLINCRHAGHWPASQPARRRPHAHARRRPRSTPSPRPNQPNRAGRRPNRPRRCHRLSIAFRARDGAGGRASHGSRSVRPFMWAQVLFIIKK